MEGFVFSGTLILDGTVQAYRATDFHVLAETPFVLKVDQASTPLHSMYRATSVQAAAFLTAWNPYSEVCQRSENIAAQQRLEDEVRRLGFELLPGIGRDPAGQWEGEESCLVLGVALPEAEALGRAFGQNAIVWAGADAIPRLILLR
jgi:hypothetical protein